MKKSIFIRAGQDCLSKREIEQLTPVLTKLSIFWPSTKSINSAERKLLAKLCVSVSPVRQFITRRSIIGLAGPNKVTKLGATYYPGDCARKGLECIRKEREIKNGANE
ncbi:hypothetical protein AVEN_96536-1 [Araneus ventricosus]|uniref:Uncharacterized protein n=1 Tax=Araneus ventricosus TaxID=182803 RepID=A0A4Y2JNY9_ARAVE|nr:hypothetical protein AVEN_96536-1 [Araneus ventricosus]